MPAAAQPLVYLDPSGDAVIRRTDEGGDGPIDPELQRLPDVVELQIGKFTPTAPEVDPFAGDWDIGGVFFRLDVTFKGLVNPPGPLGWDDVSPVYDPFLYGPNPVFGYIELDIDANENTGGELAAPELRYLGNTARFGGLPSEPRFLGRVAADASAFDQDVTTAPLVDRSGEEFHLAFVGERITSVEVLQEKPAGDPSLFEEGEIWHLAGLLFHRAHGFEEYAFTCVEKPGVYEPDVFLRFEHDSSSDMTTISLVYPLNNSGSAALIGPTEPVEPNDGCDSNQNSIEESLTDLQFSAENADPLDRLEPEFQLIAEWENTTVADCLDPIEWRLSLIVGTAYGTPEPDDARFTWTDVLPDPCIGDFNADGELTDNDVLLLNNFVALVDGDPTYDDDGNGTNGSIDWHDFAANFCLFDTNYDGFIVGEDAVVCGDMDLNQVFDIDDVDDFVLALVSPDVYTYTHNGVDPVVRGDLNDDGRLNGEDIHALTDGLLLP